MTIIHFNNGSDYNSINQMMKNGIYNLIELSMSEKKTSDKFPYYYLSIDKKISNRIFEKQISSKNEEFISSDLNDISRWSHNNSFSPNLSSKNIIVITYDNLPYEMINLQNLNNSIKDFTDHSIIFKNHFTTHNNSDETIISSLISTFFLKDKTLNQGFEKSLLPAFIENKYNIQYFADKYLQVNGLSKVLDHFKIKYVDRGNVLKSLGIKQTKERVEKQMQKLWVNQADKLHDEQSKFMFLINSSIMKNISKNNSSLATSEIISTLESLKNKEWYENTIFIITASSSSLRNNSYKLLKNYHVPLIVYLPNSNLNEEFEIISSSQDLMPSILSLLNVDYLNKSPASNSFLKNNQVAHFTHGPVLGSIEKFKGDYLVKTLEPRKIGFEQIFNQEYMKIKHSKILNATDLISFYQSIYEN